MLTLGRLESAYDRITSHIKKGQRVLDLGCGTGALTRKAARKGATVKGIDVNAQMLEIAEEKANEAGLEQRIEFSEMGVAQLGGEEAESYDVVLSGLCFSELTEDEIGYTLKQVKRILKPGGLLLIADEVSPQSISKKLLHWMMRLPLAIVTYLITQTTTQAVKRLPQRLEKEGFTIDSLRLNSLESFIEITARKPDRSAT